MEIHAPEHPIRTWKDVAVHLTIVTVGILIALGLESILEWQHHRELASEARANIRTEITENRAKVQELLTRIPKLEAQQLQVIGYMKNVLEHKPNTEHELELSWELKSIVDNSWATAQSLGALSFLPYEEVKEYAEVYELQNVFVVSSRKGEEQTTAATGFFAGNGDPANAPDWELKAAIAAVQGAYGSMQAQQQLGHGLIAEYDRALKVH